MNKQIENVANELIDKYYKFSQDQRLNISRGEIADWVYLIIDDLSKYDDRRIIETLKERRESFDEGDNDEKVDIINKVAIKEAK